MSTTNVDTVIEWINNEVEAEANEHVADNVIYAMEYAVNAMDPDAPLSELYGAVADVTTDDVIPVEVIYTADVFTIYDENTSECDYALDSIVSDLSTFDTISEAMSAAVHAWLSDGVAAAVDMVTDAARDLADEHEVAEAEAEDDAEDDEDEA